MTITRKDAVIGMKATNNAYAAPSTMMFLTSSSTLFVSLH